MLLQFKANSTNVLDNPGGLISPLANNCLFNIRSYFRFFIKNLPLTYTHFQVLGPVLVKDHFRLSLVEEGRGRITLSCEENKFDVFGKYCFLAHSPMKRSIPLPCLGIKYEGFASSRPWLCPTDAISVKEVTRNRSHKFNATSNDAWNTVKIQGHITTQALLVNLWRVPVTRPMIEMYDFSGSTNSTAVHHLVWPESMQWVEITKNNHVSCLSCVAAFALRKQWCTVRSLSHHSAEVSGDMAGKSRMNPLIESLWHLFCTTHICMFVHVWANPCESSFFQYPC